MHPSYVTRQAGVILRINAARREPVTDTPRRDWRTLCELAAEEKDPKKVLELVEKILVALDERNGVRWLPERSNHPQISGTI